MIIRCPPLEEENNYKGISPWAPRKEGERMPRHCPSLPLAPSKACPSILVFSYLFPVETIAFVPPCDIITSHVHLLQGELPAAQFLFM